MSTIEPIRPFPARVEPAPALRIVRRDDERPQDEQRRNAKRGPEDDTEPAEGEDDGRPHVDVLA